MKQRQQEMENNRNHNKEDKVYLGVAIHSQVKKIRQEMEKIKHPSLEQPETRPVLREITRHQQQQQQRSRSPLGLAERPIILVGNS